MIASLHSKARLLALAMLMALLGSLLSGCSMFKSSKSMNLGPFAENTISLLADIKHGLEAQTAVYTRDYMMDPVVMEYSETYQLYRPLLRGIAAYSLAIVTISKSTLNEKEKAGKLADVLDEMLRPRIELTNDHAILSEADLDTMLANIREQTKYLDALGAAQPLVDAIENFSHVFLDLLTDRLTAARFKLNSRIKVDHAASQKFYKVLVESQNLAFEDLSYMRDYRNGYDADALNKMFERDPQLKLLVKDPANATPKELGDLEARILFRLETVRELTAQVQPDLDLYRNKMWELDQLFKGASDNITKTRVTVIIWSRSHRGLAAGVVNPATFDVMGIAKRALGAAMPI